MQNNTHSQKNLRITTIFCIALACAALMLAAITAAPQQAHAKSYTMPEVNISADASTDASLNVIETRTFNFDGNFTAVWWTFSGLPVDASLKVNGAYISYAGTPGDTMVPLDEVSFNLKWRDEGGPGRDSFSLDSPKNTVYVFFDAADEIVNIKLDYTIVNGVTAYKDVGEVYWKYVSDQWAEASENITMTLRVPVPAGTTVTPGDNVRAWGHGPLTGDVKVNPDGTVLYTADKVNTGRFAEARVVFPRDWLTNLSNPSELSYANVLKLDQILEDEQRWADDANRDRAFSLALVIACVVLSVLLILLAIWKFIQYGKEYKPDFTDEYWRDVPSKDDHPLTMARLWRWNREDRNDFSTEIMWLAHQGAVTINQGTFDEKGKLVEDYYLVKVPAVAETLRDPIDIATMQFLFHTIAKDTDSLWFKTIEAYGKKHPERFVDKMKTWQGTISAVVNKRDFFEIKGNKWQTYLFVIAVLYAIVGVGLCMWLENFLPLIAVIPTAIVLFVFASNMPRRSREANNLFAKCEALKKWLVNFTALDERPPTDVKVWGEFMIYATVFGVAKQVIKELRVSVPEIFDDGSASVHTGYVPWWVWYGSGVVHSGVTMPSPADMLQQSVSNTFSTAEAAISAASGSSSSGGGFGGGFSGGGGGGFGGGGGAR